MSKPQYKENSLRKKTDEPRAVEWIPYTAALVQRANQDHPHKNIGDGVDLKSWSIMMPKQ